MTEEITEEFTNEVNRLCALGLTPLTAMKVAQGELKEEFEVARIENDKQAADWAKLPENREAKFKPLWDCDPAHFYLCLDGARPSEFQATAFTIVKADVKDMLSNLQSGSGRTQGPWSDRHRTKTAPTAYRWSQSLPVTPPQVSHAIGTITIVGGMHRFYLASHYGAKQTPLLVRTSELQLVRSILKSATT